MTDTRQYLKILSPAVAKRYKEKLTLYCDNIDPLCLDITKCSRDPQDMPDITTHQILSYLTLTKCPYTGQTKPQKNVEPDTGTVLQICVQKLDAISIVLGEILLESGEYLKPWLCCFPCGYILCAHCTSCSIDETCSHIGLLLYSVNKIKVEEGMLDSNELTRNTIDTIDLTDSVDNIERPLRLFVCGICGDQFEDKEHFKEHCHFMHQLPNETKVVRRKRKNRSNIEANETQIRIVNAESIVMYNDNELLAPEYVDAENLMCDDGNMEIGPIVIFNENDLMNRSNDVSNIDNSNHDHTELIIIEDEDD